MLHRYTQAMLVQISQNTACNRVHTVQQRCARWILMTHDRVNGHQYILKQEFLGQMLGEPRDSVSEATSAIKEMGLIDYTRGRITILSRPGLEAMACACYRVVRKEYDRMLETAFAQNGAKTI